jgi:hypothetical protein
LTNLKKRLSDLSFRDEVVPGDLLERVLGLVDVEPQHARLAAGLRALQVAGRPPRSSAQRRISS